MKGPLSYRGRFGQRRPVLLPRYHHEKELVKKLRLMSEVPVITLLGTRKISVPAPAAARGPPVPVVAVRASTGGLAVLQTILSRLQKNLSAAILIVQLSVRAFFPRGCLESGFDRACTEGSVAEYSTVVFAGHKHDG